VRRLATIDGLVATEGVETELGDVGTRHVLADDGFGGSRAIVVDPVDGYVLATSHTSMPEVGSEGVSSIHTPAGAFAVEGVLETTTTHGRPVAEGRIPDDVAALAAAVRSDPPSGDGTCATASGNEDLGGAVLVVPVPRHLAYAYCPRG